MSRYIEQEHIGKTVSNLPTEVFQTENRIELVLSATEVIDAIKDAPSIDIVRCGECKKRDDDYVCYKWASVDECPRVRPNDFCSYGEREGE